MSSFLDELRREVLDAHEAHASRGRAKKTLRRRPPLLRLAFGAAVLAALAAVFAVLAVRERNQPNPVAPRIVGKLHIVGSPVGAVAFDGSLWIADDAGRSVVRIDAEDRRAVARIPVGGQPGFIAAAADGGLWVHTGTSGTDMATVHQIDPDADRVIARTAVGPEGPMTVAAGFVWTAVWAALDNRPREGLYRVDARSRETSPRIPLPGVDDIAAAGANVWALTSNGTLARLDARTARIERRWRQLGLPAGTAAGANAMAAGGDGVWLLSTPQVGEGSLVHVEGDRVDRRLPLAPSALPVLAVARDGVWTAHGNELSDRYSLTRLDPVSGRVTATVPLGGVRPVGLVPMGDELWVVGDDGTVVIVGA